MDSTSIRPLLSCLGCLATFVVVSSPAAQITYDSTHPVRIEEAEQYTATTPVMDNGTPRVLVTLSQLAWPDATGVDVTVQNPVSGAWSQGTLVHEPECLADFYSEVRGNVSHQLHGDTSILRFEPCKQMTHCNQGSSGPGELNAFGTMRSTEDDVFPIPPGWAEFDVPFGLTAAVNRVTVEEFSVTRTITQSAPGGLIQGSATFSWGLYEDKDEDGAIGEGDVLLHTDTVLAVSGTDSKPESVFFLRDKQYVLRLTFDCASVLQSSIAICGPTSTSVSNDLTMSCDGLFQMKVEGFGL